MMQALHPRVQPLMMLNGGPLSAPQVFQYLHSAGVLNQVLRAITEQHILEQAIVTHAEPVKETQVQQAIQTLRQKLQLCDPKAYSHWLTEKGWDEVSFATQIRQELLVNRLKAAIIEPHLQEVFIRDKLLLDQVVLSRIVVQEEGLAAELFHQITEDGVTFEQLAREYSQAPDAQNSGRMKVVSRGRLPDLLRAGLDALAVGEILGPLLLDEVWYLIRLEAIHPAQFDSAMKKQLLDEEFQRWLVQRCQDTTVNLFFESEDS